MVLKLQLRLMAVSLKLWHVCVAARVAIHQIQVTVIMVRINLIRVHGVISEATIILLKLRLMSKIRKHGRLIRGEVGNLGRLVKLKWDYRIYIDSY